MSGGDLPQFVDAERYTPVFTTAWLHEQSELPYTRMQLEKGECLFMAQERHAYTYHVESGLIKLFLLSREGAVKTLFYHTEGTQLGFQGFKHDGTTVSTAVADAPSVVLAIRYPDLLAFCNRHPEYYRAYIEHIMQVTNSQTQQIANLSFHTGMKRLAALLSSLASAGDQPGTASGDSAEGTAIPYTIDELADIIGAHRNTVSNALAQLRNLGLIADQHRPIVVRDPEALRRWPG